MIVSLQSAFLAERARWILWLPVAFGAGIATYFGLPVEPPLWLGPLLLGCATVAGVCFRRHDVMVLLACGAFFGLLGFSIAVYRSASVAAPVLAEPVGPIAIEGRIAEIEPLEHGVLRLVLDHVIWPQVGAPTVLPARIRVRLGQGSGDWQAGQGIALRAMLLPPPDPAAPGTYDFSRQAWFQGIGAVGYAVGRPRRQGDAAFDGLRERLRLHLAAVRHALTERIVAAVADAGIGAGSGAVAAALITAERGSVSPEILQAYRDAGLAHVLVIAGMHMSMVAGLVFVALRSGLAAIPWLALRYPIKKWTAAGALCVTFAYLVISGAPVPTQRAFTMNAIVLLAVLFDREAISLRSITWAALLVLTLHPEALVGASFQMSFAAVYGLISGYEAIGPILGRWRHGHRSWWSQILFYVGGILLTTQIAGTATAFYTVFHFNRFATYGLLGNCLAVPIVGFWVMPSALLAFCLMPFGLDGWGWQSMGWGIFCISRIALWVSSLPGASIDLPSVPTSALILFSLGGLWLVLWKKRWRLFGLAGVIAGIGLGVVVRPPDMLVSASGQVMAARANDGRMTFSPGWKEKSLRGSWAKQAGQGGNALAWYDNPDDRLHCDRWSCRYRAGGHVVLFLRQQNDRAIDCRDVDWVVGSVAPPEACPLAAGTIDRQALHQRGTHALWLHPEGVETLTVADWQGRRPWSHFSVAAKSD